MPFPTVYSSKESAIASYSYEDIAEGTGIKLFYGANQSTGGVKDYFLTTSSLYSNDIYSDIGASGAYVDFDVMMNTPRTIKGNAYFSATVGGNGDGSAVIGYKAILKHYDGGVGSGTILATGASDLFTGASGVPGGQPFTVLLPVTEQYFKAGDILRLTYITQGAGAWTTKGFGHDPANRNATTITGTQPTQLKLYIPFRIDL